jgi:mannose-1-phosphate guanylyltransferase
MSAARVEDSNLNAIILAGGDGSRLSALTRKISGQELPKQFCPIFENTTLLEQTARRISIAIPPKQTLIVLSRQHERFYKPFSCNVGDDNLVVQPRNRGTAAAILYALFCLIRRGRRGIVAIFPSDHYVGDDRRFMLHVKAASSVAAEFPERLLLLGIPADKPESQYGWIEPAQPLDFDLVANGLMGIGPAFHIRRFWEKPSPEVASELCRQGFFWNSFVIVAGIAALLDLFARASSQLYISFAQLFSFFGTANESEAIAQLYDNIPSVSFSDNILTEFCAEFLVLPVRGVQWSDLGDPTRVLNIIAQLGVRPKWLAA